MGNRRRFHQPIRLLRYGKMYKTRFRRWDLWKHSSQSNPAHQTHAPDDLRHEEMVYRALRDYYDGAFAARRWAFEGDHDRQAIARTQKAMRAGEETYSRFRAAVLMLERPSCGNNRGKTGDFAQGVRLMRISFAELPRFVCPSSSCEPPLLPLWMMYVTALFRESSARDFRPVERQLLRHLHELTVSPPGVGGPVHPTAVLWRTLWLGIQNGPSNYASSGRRHHLAMCANIAVERFSRQIGPLHPWTVELRGLAIGLIHPNGEGNPDDKTRQFRSLLQDLENQHPTYDPRHIVVVSCWASHYRHHGVNQALSIDKYPDGAFNVYSLLANMSYRLHRWDVAEESIRHATALARRHREETGEDGDLFEGLNGLEVILRAQGKVVDADTVQEERQRLVRDGLERVGEKEESVE
ncbi:unnamed protein product [Parascedosporium putredinis]|uniref:Uncharacterized protein n=1 Tax=Parascedosporium putredinis TaxID=1442378 RepID=A0A9P1H4H6_9PEZI|nr:unnamed protein product [Parascedosporium putredinis]CAI7996761.1 unnamed protein product [Parascedosporium putredinis]